MRKKDSQIPGGSTEDPGKTGRKKAGREIRWDKLDNSAHLFPVISGERMTSVYRISVTLTELVDPSLLQRALDTVLPRYDAFDLRLRRGFFWHYFEENGKVAPEVEEEKRFPCRFIRADQNNSYLFRVTYYKYRINVEVFHVLTDGLGTVNFLKELTYQYLRFAHPELMGLTGDSLSCGMTMNREDSFLKNYRKGSGKKEAGKKAYELKGEKLAKGELGVMHGYIDIPSLKQVCRRYGTSINEYLVGTYIWSVYTEYLRDMDPEVPIQVAVPVNLRPYFNSTTTKNFFVMTSASFYPDREDYTFEQVLELVCKDLRSQMTTENLEQVFSQHVFYQKNLAVRLLPLPLKKIIMREAYRRSARQNTTTITNIGRIEVAEAYRPYVEMFHAFLAISKGQHIRGTVCSYEDTLVFSFSYDLADPSVQRGFFRQLARDGLQVEVESNGVSYG